MLNRYAHSACLRFVMVSLPPRSYLAESFIGVNILSFFNVYTLFI